MEIEKNIPRRAVALGRHGRDVGKEMGAILTMGIGDSFFTSNPEKSLSRTPYLLITARQYERKNKMGRKYEARKEEKDGVKGWRVWRIA